MDGLIITVNYKTSETTIQFLESITKLNDFSKVELFIVDNGSEKIVVEKISNYLKKINQPNIRLITLPENIGYFGAVNYAIKNHIQEIEKYKYCIVCNNDIVIKDNNFLEKVSCYSGINDTIAPRIISLVSGKDQNPHMEHSVSFSQKIQYRLLFSNYYIGFILYFFRIAMIKVLALMNKKKINLSERNIFAMHGSCMIFSGKYFLKGGYIDDGSFLYGEETSVTAICKLINCTIRFVPDLIVYHDEHKTSMANGLKKRIYGHQKEAYRYIKRKYKKLIYGF
ncbi:MAG: glycosyltransferase [Bacteroidales bacterium]